MIKRNSIYQYNTEQDYEYKFDHSRSTLINVNLINGKLKLPDEISENQSVFLKVFVKTKLFGNYFEPSIKIKANKNTCTQYFEMGAKGYRYVNLSSLTQENVKELVFVGSKIALEDQVAQLIVFEDPDLSKSKILVIAPHPDDAEIAAYGLYSKYPKSFILTITLGEAGDFKYDELYRDTTKHYLKKGELRTWNSITTPILGGISHDSILNLGFFDTTLEEMYSKNPLDVKPYYIDDLKISTYRNLNTSNLKNHIKGTSNWTSLVENIKWILEEVNPDIIVTPYPLIDKHNDHKFSTIALFQALKELEIKEGSLFLYTNHFTNDYYPLGEMGSIITLPPNFKNDIYFNSIYSNSLNESLQIDKLFALESMHDLRLDTEWRFWDKQIKESTHTLGRKILGKEKDYFRRAVRSNELFFVVPILDIYDDTKLEYLVGSHTLN